MTDLLRKVMVSINETSNQVAEGCKTLVEEGYGMEMSQDVSFSGYPTVTVRYWKQLPKSLVSAAVLDV